MKIGKQNPLDPLIRTKHAISFFDGVQLRFATKIGAHAPQISSLIKKDPDGYLPAIYAFRLREACPEIMDFCAELEKVEVSND